MDTMEYFSHKSYRTSSKSSGSSKGRNFINSKFSSCSPITKRIIKKNAPIVEPTDEYRFDGVFPMAAKTLLAEERFRCVSESEKDIRSLSDTDEDVFEPESSRSDDNRCLCRRSPIQRISDRGRKKNRVISQSGAVTPVIRFRNSCSERELSTDEELSSKDSSSLRNAVRSHHTLLPSRMKLRNDDNLKVSSNGPPSYDVVGLEQGAHFPWQRDAGVQCTIADDERFDDGRTPAWSPLSHAGNSAQPSPSGFDARLTLHEDSVRLRSAPGTRNMKHKRKQPVRPYSFSVTPNTVEKEQSHSGRKEMPTSTGNKGERSNSLHVDDEEMRRARECRSHSETADYIVGLNSSRRSSGLFGSMGFFDDLLTRGTSVKNQVAKRHDISGNRSSSTSVQPLLNIDDEFTGHDVLPSPRVSPVSWSKIPELVVTETGEELQRKRSIAGYEQNFLTVPHRNDTETVTERRPVKVTRRASIGSVHSTSDDSDDELPSPPRARRGRRAAIFESKNVGDVSPTSVSPDISPSNSNDEAEEQGHDHPRLRRRRSSVDLGMQVCPGDLMLHEQQKKILIKRNTIADFHSKSQHGSTTSLHTDQSGDSRKVKNSFSLLKLIDKKTRSKECQPELSVSIGKLKPSEFKDNTLLSYKDVHWSDLIASKDGQPVHTSPISETERKRRECVWELFKSELIFLIDHLMVLKHCFMEPMKQLQVDGHLMFAEPQDLFGNLDELCYVSYTFCRDFISLLLKDITPSNFGSTSVLIKAFKRFSQHSKNGEVYHTYCLNYTNALNYLDQLRKNDDFCEYEKWCELDYRCKRLQLTDMLVAPMQHCTKLPLLLARIKKETENEQEKQQLSESIDKTEKSLRNLEEKMKWLTNFERVQEIQRQLVWQPITELDPRVYVPEFLKQTLSRQPCERLLASPKRQLLHEGQLMMMESSKPCDVMLFLFDDILLLAKAKGSKPTRKKSSIKEPTSETNSVGAAHGRLLADCVSLVVYKQPIALDRFTIHDVGHHEATINGLRHAFVLVQISRFQQIIGVHTLMANTESVKATWMAHLREAKDKYREKSSDMNSSLKKRKSPKMTLKHLKLHPNLQQLHLHHDMGSQESPSPSPSPAMKDAPEQLPTDSDGRDSSPDDSQSKDNNNLTNHSHDTGDESAASSCGSQSPPPYVPPTVPLLHRETYRDLNTPPFQAQFGDNVAPNAILSPTDQASYFDNTTNPASTYDRTRSSPPFILNHHDHDYQNITLSNHRHQYHPQPHSIYHQHDVIDHSNITQNIDAVTSSSSTDPIPSFSHSDRNVLSPPPRRISRKDMLRHCHSKAKSIDSLYL